MLPMNVSDLVTLIITTSPTPSAPSAQLLTAVFQSFREHCPDLLACKVIIVFDTYDSITGKARLKKGQVTREGAEAFEFYKVNVKQLVLSEFLVDLPQDSLVLSESHAEAEFGYFGHAENSVSISVRQTPDRRVTFIEPKQRLGFGLAVRTALRCVTTPYVWVHQHDWTLSANIPLRTIIAVMHDHQDETAMPVRYIGLPSVRSLSYAIQTDTLRFSSLHSFTKNLKQSFTPSTDGSAQLPLTPMFHWPDKPHICSTAHYLSRVFPYRTSIGRGDFIEDTTGHIARDEMKEGNWHKWATWLYYPKDGKELCLRHLDGRVWRGTVGEEERKLFWQEKMRDDTKTKDRNTRANMEASLDGSAF